jgi:hypothetical protein
MRLSRSTCPHTAQAVRRRDVIRVRDAIVKSALLTPDAVDEREPLWIEFFEARKRCDDAGDPNPVTVLA